MFQHQCAWYHEVAGVEVEIWVCLPLLHGVVIAACALVPVSEVEVHVVLPRHVIAAINYAMALSRAYIVIYITVVYDGHIGVDKEKVVERGLSCEEIPDGGPSHIILPPDILTAGHLCCGGVLLHDIFVSGGVIGNNDFVVERVDTVIAVL